MMSRISNMLNELEDVNSKEQMVSMEDQIAAALGSGFLKGEIDYGNMQLIKQQVELIEQEKRKSLGLNIQTRQTGHVR